MKAFPVEYKNPQSEGMDLRDYFAIHIVQAMITNHKIEKNHPNEDSIIQDAYIIFDRMMEARK
jgi:hypothetical protein